MNFERLKEALEQVLRIGICDDSLTELEIVSVYIDAFTREHKELNLSAYAFRSPSALLDYIEKTGAFDILLLDIIMDGLNGIEVAKEVRARGERCEILYLTSSRAYAVEAFGVGAANYLLKPVAKEALFSALLAVVERLHSRRAKSLLKKTDAGIRKIEHQDIIYIESDKHRQCVHLCTGEAVLVNDTLGALFEELSSSRCFFMPHRAYIVNMDYITGITSKDIRLSDGSTIPIPKNTYARVRDAYVDFTFSTPEEKN